MTEMNPPDTLRPGERLFALLLVVFSGYAFWESYGISGFEGLTTGGVVPMLASGVMLITAISILAAALKKPPATQSSVGGLVDYLFPLRVVLFTGLIGAFVVSIPLVGFLQASTVFLFVAITWLWRRGPLRALAITGISVAVIYLLFRVVFQVILPAGSLWQ